jgi:hypothetical protein
VRQCCLAVESVKKNTQQPKYLDDVDARFKVLYFVSDYGYERTTYDFECELVAETLQTHALLLALIEPERM